MKQKTPLLIIGLALVVGFCLFSLGCNEQIKVSAIETPASTIKSDNPVLKVFIENSGSMDGYMCDGSQLKDAIFDYVSDLNRYTHKTELFYINSQIIPYQGNITSYIKTLNPASFQQAGGNRSNTDLGEIIDQVLQTVNDTTVSIFVSDCILDLPASDSKRFLTNCQILIKSAVINTQKRVPDLGVEILKLSSDFNGKYFYQDNSYEILTDVKRPYYIWIFGNKNYLAKLNSEVPLSLLDNYGLEGVVVFSNQSAVPFEISSQGTGQTITASNGKYNVRIKADMRATLQPDAAVRDYSNYSFNSSAIKISDIKPIVDKHSNFTHYIDFSIPSNTHIVQENLIFNTPEIPSWVGASNDITGKEITQNLEKTTGIQSLIQGVADAYKGETTASKMKFNVKKK